MSKKNSALEAEMLGFTPADSKKQSQFSWMRFLRRFLLLLFTLVLMTVGAASLFLGTVFHGPSPIARNMLNLALLEDSRTAWIPGLFLDEEPIELPAAQEG